MHRDKKQISSCQTGWGKGRMGVTATGYGVSFQGDEMFQKLWLTQICVTTLNIIKSTEVYTLKVNYIVYELHLNKISIGKINIHTTFTFPQLSSTSSIAFLPVQDSVKDLALYLIITSHYLLIFLMGYNKKCINGYRCFGNKRGKMFLLSLS